MCHYLCSSSFHWGKCAQESLNLVACVLWNTLMQAEAAVSCVHRWEREDQPATSTISSKSICVTVITGAHVCNCMTETLKKGFVRDRSWELRAHLPSRTRFSASSAKCRIYTFMATHMYDCYASPKLAHVDHLCLVFNQSQSFHILFLLFPVQQ